MHRFVTLLLLLAACRVAPAPEPATSTKPKISDEDRRKFHEWLCSKNPPPECNVPQPHMEFGAPAIGTPGLDCDAVEAHLNEARAALQAAEQAHETFSNEHCHGDLVLTERHMQGRYGAQDMVEGVWMCERKQIKYPQGFELISRQQEFEQRRRGAKKLCNLD